jgi:hypothetical protein
MRCRSLIGSFALLALVGVFASWAGASSGVKATLTRTVHAAPPGSSVAVAWKLHDASGRIVLQKHVFVKITCPEGDRSTITYANPSGKGTYLVSAMVPPGGVGSITVGHAGAVYPVTNPYHG